jgi:hypothetical protein
VPPCVQHGIAATDGKGAELLGYLPAAAAITDESDQAKALARVAVGIVQVNSDLAFPEV